MDNDCDDLIDEGCEEPEEYHEADDNENGCIEINELMSYIGRWKIGDVDMIDLIEVIGLWKSRDGC